MCPSLFKSGFVEFLYLFTRFWSLYRISVLLGGGSCIEFGQPYHGFRGEGGVAAFRCGLGVI